MLPSLLGYSRGAGVDARWLVVEGEPDFFRVTKRVHHALHGSCGDGSPLDAAARRLYEGTLARAALELDARVRRRDVVILHDPQTAGLAPRLVAAGALVIWRSHIGTEDLDDLEVQGGWSFLAPYLATVPGLVFSRGAYVPAAYRERASVISPSIDTFATKNVEARRGDDSLHPRPRRPRRGAAAAGSDAILPAWRRYTRSCRAPRRHRAPRPGAWLVVPAGRTGLALGSAQGHARRAAGLRALRRGAAALRRAPRCSPGRTFMRWPTIPKARRSSPRWSAPSATFPLRSVIACTLPSCPASTWRRTRRS